MSLGRGYQDESATFDDVAMILLFFFLVMAFFAFNKKFLDLDEAKTQKAGPAVAPQLVPVPPTLDLVTHSELDFLLYVDSESSFRVVNLGGSESFSEASVEATSDAKMEGFKSTERTEAAVELRKKLVPPVRVLLEAPKWADEGVRLFVGGHPEALHGALFQSYAGFLLARRDLQSYGFGERLTRVPCPAQNDALTIARALNKRNACLLRKLSADCGVSDVKSASEKGGACEEAMRLGKECSETDQQLLECALETRRNCDELAGGVEKKDFCDWKVFENDRKEAAAGPQGEGVEAANAPPGDDGVVGQLDDGATGQP